MFDIDIEKLGVRVIEYDREFKHDKEEIVAKEMGSKCCVLFLV